MFCIPWWNDIPDLRRASRGADPLMWNKLVLKGVVLKQYETIKSYHIFNMKQLNYIIYVYYKSYIF